LAAASVSQYGCSLCWSPLPSWGLLVLACSPSQKAFVTAAPVNLSLASYMQRWDSVAPWCLPQLSMGACLIVQLIYNFIDDMFLVRQLWINIICWTLRDSEPSVCADVKPERWGWGRRQMSEAKCGK
jgi:hypothetical protein